MVSAWVDVSQEKRLSGMWSSWSCHSLVIDRYQSPWAARVAASASASVSAMNDLADDTHLELERTAPYLTRPVFEVHYSLRNCTGKPATLSCQHRISNSRS